MQHLIPTTNTLQDRVFEYYTAVAPIIEAGFAGAPIIYSTVPTPTRQRGEFRVTGIPLSAQGLLGLVRDENALSFFTWAPLAADSHRLRFARILLEAPPGVGFDRVRLAALAMRAALFESRQWKAVALLDGGNGIALWGSTVGRSGGWAAAFVVASAVRASGRSASRFAFHAGKHAPRRPRALARQQQRRRPWQRAAV